ncbi:MAG TPA: LytTR family DNA-binding domain-containing protein [Cyclobacteriaceae bacterium]|nr:LytTR family DNA-binding domain-containing protein [Cyclobacteriaceae bacterium]
MNILIIEDEPNAAERLISLIQQQRQVNILGQFDTVTRSVDWLKKNQTPDLIFMDIQLADGLSFQIFEQVTVNAPVIFTTAYNEYALKAFKVNSIEYLLKPIDAEELRAAFAKYETLTGKPTPDKMMESISYAMQMLTKKYKERFMVKVGEHLKTIAVNEILFFFSLEKTTFAQTTDGRKHILDFTLDQLDALLNPAQYFRINRKYIVQADSIKDMISHTNSRIKLVLKTSDDDDVIVARERVQEFKDWLDK